MEQLPNVYWLKKTVLPVALKISRYLLFELPSAYSEKMREHSRSSKMQEPSAMPAAGL